jgi:hypothetical protein
MKNYQVTVNLNFDITFDVTAKNEDEIEIITDEMKLADFLEWSGCASYNVNIVNIEENL